MTTKSKDSLNEKAVPQSETEEEVKEVKETSPKTVFRISADRLMINQKEYKLLTDFREGFDLDSLNDRYSDVLNKYDFIVGDIGFDQLRLKGFFEDYRKKVAVDQKISALEDYLYEYCNFGCAYFVLEKVEKDKEVVEKRAAHVKEKKGKPRTPKQQTRKKNQGNFKNQKKGKTNQPAKPKPNQRGKKHESPVKEKKSSERHFTIRQKEQG
ncbi:YutD family protein [Vagococcus elongatus]|nr:YutD family protein [Vagococcus elongatus]